MDVARFDSRSPGRLVRTVEGAWAFVPAPLPPEVPISVRAMNLLADASMAIGRLNQAAIQHVNPEQLIPSLSKREAVMSSKIEGTRTTLQEAFVDPDQGDADPDRQEVLNYEHALRIGVDAMRAGRGLGFSLAKELHVRLLSGVRGTGKSPGAYRDAQVFLGSEDDIHRARFVPPPPGEVAGCLEQLQAWLDDQECAVPKLVKIGLTHYQFEAIHPFADGNGRIGRLLIALQFLAEGVVRTPLLYVSPYLEARRDAYYEALFRVSSEGAFTEWIEFFLASVLASAEETMDRITAIEELLSQFGREVADATQSHNPLRLVESLRVSPFTTIPDVARELGTSPQVARNAVKTLMDLGILAHLQIQKKTRKRGKNPDYYFCPALWRVINR